jgi:hypothetical protein
MLICDNCGRKNKQIIQCQEISVNNCPYTVTKLLPAKLMIGIIYFFVGLLFSVPGIYTLTLDLNNLYLLIFSAVFLVPIVLWGFIVSSAGLFMIYSSFAVRYLILEKNGDKRYQFSQLKIL